MSKLSVQLRNRRREDSKQMAPLAHLIGRSRFIVLLAALAVLLVSISLFLLGTFLAAVTVWAAGTSVLSGELDSTHLTVSQSQTRVV
jgi:hypothetical protein